MKKTFITLAAIAAAISFTSCENLPEQAPSLESTPLTINVGVQTKELITETTLPDASEIGIYLVDNTGSTYQGVTNNNIKVVASGIGETQKWTTEQYIGLTETVGTLYSYYPYSAEATNKTSIAVKADAENQVDYLYSTPLTDINNNNATANLSMNHALAALRFNVLKAGYQGPAVLSSIAIQATNIATSATLDVTTGTLSNLAGGNSQITHTINDAVLSAEAQTFEFIVIPETSISSNINLILTVDDSAIEVNIPNTTLTQGTINEYTINMDSGATLTKVNVNQWNTTENVTYTSEYAIPAKVGIKHKDGTVYTSAQWTAALNAGTITNADACGVAVPDPNNEYNYLCVLHPTAKRGSTTWSSSTSVLVDGVFTTEDETTAATDYAGQANTNAILAAVAAGTIEDAPAAEYCASITFADGKTGYLPAAGEVQQMKNYKTDINACLAACGGTELDFSPSLWSSTQSPYTAASQNYSTSAWSFNYLSPYLKSIAKYYDITVRVVSAF